MKFFPVNYNKIRKDFSIKKIIHKGYIKLCNNRFVGYSKTLSLKYLYQQFF